jgi:hypothetical protein
MPANPNKRASVDPTGSLFLGLARRRSPVRSRLAPLAVCSRFSCKRRRAPLRARGASGDMLRPPDAPTRLRERLRGHRAASVSARPLASHRAPPGEWISGGTGATLPLMQLVPLTWIRIQLGYLGRERENQWAHLSNRQNHYFETLALVRDYRELKAHPLDDAGPRAARWARSGAQSLRTEGFRRRRLPRALHRCNAVSRRGRCVTSRRRRHPCPGR